MNQPILACHIHDYVEVACMYRYQVTLLMKVGKALKGQCLDTGINPEKVEYLLLRQGEQKIEVPLLNIQTLLVETPKAQFQRVAFTKESDPLK